MKGANEKRHIPERSPLAECLWNQTNPAIQQKLGTVVLGCRFYRLSLGDAFISFVPDKAYFLKLPICRRLSQYPNCHFYKEYSIYITFCIVYATFIQATWLTATLMNSLLFISTFLPIFFPHLILSSAFVLFFLLISSKECTFNTVPWVLFPRMPISEMRVKNMQPVTHHSNEQGCRTTSCCCTSEVYKWLTPSLFFHEQSLNLIILKSSDHFALDKALYLSFFLSKGTASSAKMISGYKFMEMTWNPKC